MTMTVNEYFTDWVNSRKPLVKLSTHEAETIYFNKHIIPYFSIIANSIDEITPLQVRNFTRYELEKGRLDGKDGGLSPVSVKKHLSLLRQSLDEAVILDIIKSNPAASVRLPKRKGKQNNTEAVFLTASEAQILLDSFKEHELYEAVALALFYGLRRSEVLGLRWCAIDFEKNTLSVNHTVVKNLTIEACDSTKSETSRRTFQLLPEVRTMLLNYKSRSRAEAVYLFEHADGTPLRPDSLTRQFQKQLSKAGLAKMRFHDLRHSTASILFDRGWNLEDVKNWLGHSDIETTSNIYLHYGRNRKILLADSLTGIFNLKEKSP